VGCGFFVFAFIVRCMYRVKRFWTVFLFLLGPRFFLMITLSWHSPQEHPSVGRPPEVRFMFFFFSWGFVLEGIAGDAHKTSAGSPLFLSVVLFLGQHLQEFFFCPLVIFCMGWALCWSLMEWRVLG